MNKISLLLCIIAISAITGCVSQRSSSRGGVCSGKSFNQLMESTDLKPLFNDIAREMCADCSQPGTEKGSACKAGSSVLVTDFVDIQSFSPSPQGLLMGELMRGSLNSVCGHKINQVEFAKYFNLNEKGLVVLSRKVSEIKKDDYDQSEAIVGTYSYLNNKIILFVRKINIVTGKISRMVTREVNYNCSGGSIGYTVK